MDIQRLVRLPIAWEASGESEYVFLTEVDGEAIRLRLNDFPEEPLCTVIWAEGEQDLNDLGKEWTLPKHRQDLGR